MAMYCTSLLSIPPSKKSTFEYVGPQSLAGLEVSGQVLRHWQSSSQETGVSSTEDHPGSTLRKVQIS